MYSDKENVNILTSIMLAHGVTTVVVCPGSRNATLAHNFSVHPSFRCISVTDERSAGFYALGIATAQEIPVAVCVTSGSALLNVFPAVSEAFYRGIALMVISADRPQAMIGQLQGQTLPQQGVFGLMVRVSVQLPEPHDDVERWYCNRLVNEAIIKMRHRGSGPVHVNIPISEPLYNFTLPTLPIERKMVLTPAIADVQHLAPIATAFATAERPLVVIGQMERSEWHKASSAITRISQSAVVLIEKLSDDSSRQLPSLDTMVSLMQTGIDYAPDFVVYLGGNLVAKSMRQYLQEIRPQRSIVVSPSGEVTDVLMNATDIVESSPSDFLSAIAEVVGPVRTPSWYARWNELMTHALAEANAPVVVNEEDIYHHRLHNDAIRRFFLAIKDKEMDVHVANSMSVRMSLKYADRYIYVNRGVNGIEGSLSTAAGHSLVSSCPVVCIIGDLSFFYDSNALWHEGLSGNLRILLLNNGCGGIFSKFKGLEGSPARESLVMARHNTDARGVCQQNNVAYRRVGSVAELDSGIAWFIGEASSSPMLLEVVM